MTTSHPTTATARRYLRELDAALAPAPRALRVEILADITSELTGLDDAQTAARIAELGDPRAIAADALAEQQSEPAPPSKTYPTVTAIVLTVGWYLAPVLGWIGGLVMIGVGDRWLPAFKRRAILSSIGAGVLAGVALLVFRGTDLWPVGLTAFLVIPLLVNIFVGSALRANWR
ncbi:MAG: hypothetical protein Q7T71_16380 [Herbiconiux sp.]|nr:hypothetical protein [Herbiconiux sp.]